MTWNEFQAAYPNFIMVGGPWAGKRSTAAYRSWPSVIRILNTDGTTAVYQMRIGSLEHYDYLHDEPRT